MGATRTVRHRRHRPPCDSRSPRTDSSRSPEGSWLALMHSASKHGRERQVRLKPQHADLYPGILPAEWVPAWAMAERLLALAEKAGVRPNERVCNSRHFDLRGSTSLSAPELRDLRTPCSMYQHQEEHSMTATTTTPTAVKISGQAELQYSKRENIDVPGREGHGLALGEVRGTNQNTSASDFFADVSAINVETADLMQGNGSHQGYYTMRKGDDAVTAEWHGTVTTVIGPDQQPQTSVNGTWEYIRVPAGTAESKAAGTMQASFWRRIATSSAG